MLHVFNKIAKPKGFKELKNCSQDGSSNCNLKDVEWSWVKSNTSAVVWDVVSEKLLNYYI